MTKKTTCYLIAAPNKEAARHDVRMYCSTQDQTSREPAVRCVDQVWDSTEHADRASFYNITLDCVGFRSNPPDPLKKGYYWYVVEVIEVYE